MNSKTSSKIPLDKQDKKPKQIKKISSLIAKYRNKSTDMNNISLDANILKSAISSKIDRTEPNLFNQDE